MMYKYYNQIYDNRFFEILNEILKLSFPFSEVALHDIFGKLNLNNEELDFYNTYFKTEKFKNIHNRFSQLAYERNYYSKLSDSQIIYLLENIISTQREDYSQLAYLINEYNKRFISKNNNDEVIIKYMFYNNIDSLSVNIEHIINHEYDDFLQFDIKKILENDLTINLFETFDLKTFSDLLEYKIEIISLLLIKDIEKISCFCKYIYKIKNNEFLRFLKHLDDKIYNIKWRQVLYTRYDMNGIKHTLEEIGFKLNLTRERIRQILKKCSTIISKQKEDLLKFFCVIYEFNKNDFGLLENKFLLNYNVSEVELDGLYKKNLIAIIFAFLEDNEIEDITQIHFSKEYQSFYYKNLEELYEKSLNDFDDIILKSDLNDYNDFEQKIILEEYKENDILYYKKRLKKSKMYCDIADELYPEGFKAYSEDVVKSVNIKFNEIYGTDIFIDERTFSSYVEREKYCLIDRGTYINFNRVIMPDEELINKIKNYIIEKKSVYYTSILERFKKEFNSINVNNWYFVKGLVDATLADSFEKNKSNISINDTTLKANELIKKYINDFTGIFTIPDIIKEFPGVKDYLLLSIISEMNNIIMLSNNKFFNINNVKLENEDIEFFQNNIKYLMDSLKVNTISARKLYSRIKILNPKILSKFYFIKDDFSFFSLLKYIFKNNYSCNRPFISIDKNTRPDTKQVILDFVSEFDNITIKEVYKFTDKMNMRKLSKIEIMDLLKNNYVQYDREDFIKKELLDIRKYDLSEIQKVLLHYIKDFGNIKLDKFNYYTNFPKLNKRWNKYLLIGIVNTFMNDVFELINVGENSLLGAIFEIRMVK